MPSHRKIAIPVRPAVSLAAGAAAAAAGVGLTPAAGHAATVADVQSQVATLDAQAERETEAYDGAMEQLATLQKQVDAIQSQAVSTQQSMNRTLAALGPLAAAQYRSGSMAPGLELLLSAHPETYLQQASMMSRLGDSEAAALAALKSRRATLASLKKEAADRLAQVQQVETRAAAAKTAIVSEIRKAQGLLAQLTAGQRQALATSGVSAAQIAGIPRATGRAAVAIAFAKSKLGLPYQWGGTGNPSYDCSGLTQASWAAAGVSLGRTTYDQVTDGYAVPAVLADLQPGDLIFYDDNTHMALYLGNGVVIHAPSTGQRIQYGPWNMLPIDAVRRVA